VAGDLVDSDGLVWIEVDLALVRLYTNVHELTFTVRIAVKRTLIMVAAFFVHLEKSANVQMIICNRHTKGFVLLD